MQSNPVLKRLGFSENDKVVVIHTDDIGMCQASVDAFSDLHKFGIISSGAIMTPCAWSLAVGEFAQEHPEADLGVHTTLTSEWSTYRWGPLSTRDPKSGLMDAFGYFHKTCEAVNQFADPICVTKEIEAQIEFVQKMGIDPTHIDTHMGAVVSEKFLEGYIMAGVKRGIPPMLIRFKPEELIGMGMSPEAAQIAVMKLAEVEAMGVPMYDSLQMMPLDTPENRLERIKSVFSDMKAGLTYFIIHPAKDTPETRAISPDWAARVADYEVFMSEEMREHIKNLGIQVIGYRQLKNLMPTL
jgi:predicted glycoside hydrolase/deacetylase ChbG (UPF0249 family)